MLSQSELARLCDVSQQTVSSWKKGSRTPSLYTKRKLLKIVEDSEQQSRLHQLSPKELDQFASKELDLTEDKTLARLFESMSQDSKRELIETIKRQKADEELQAALKENDRVISSAPDALWSAEFVEALGFNVTYASPVIEKITGYPPYFFKLASNNWKSIIHPDDLHIWEDTISQIPTFSNEQSIEKEYRILTADSRTIWVRDCVSVQRRSINKLFVNGIISDITERKNTEAIIRAKEKNLRCFFNQAPIGFYRSSLDGQILKANDFLIKMFGYPDKKSFLDLNAEALFSESKIRRNILKITRDSEATHNFEAKARRSDGAPFWVSISARAVRDANKNLLYLEKCLIDISESKRTEALLCSLKSAIPRGETQTINKQTEPLESAETSEIIRIKKISSAIALYELEKGTLKLKPGGINALPVLLKIKKELRMQENEKKLQLEIMLNGKCIQKTDTFIMRSEQILLHLMLENIINAAYQSTPSGGKLTACLKEDEHKNSISIKAQGFQSDCKEQRKIPFPAIENATRAAQAHGGSIKVNSSPKSGTTITVRLPK